MKRFISFLLALVLLIVLAVPAIAADSSSSSSAPVVEVPSTGNFWQWMAGNSPDGIQAVVGLLASGVCPISEDGKHHGYLTGRAAGGKQECKCNDCGETYMVTDAEVDAAYQAYLDGLANTTVDSSGKSLHCYPSSFINMMEVSSLSEVEQESFEGLNQTRYFPDPYTLVQTTITGSFYYSFVNVYFQVPVSGNYYVSWPANVYSGSSAYIYLWGNRKSIYCDLDYPGTNYSSPAITSQSHYFCSDTIYAFQVYPYASLEAGYLTTHSTSVSLIPDESTFSGNIVDSSVIISRPQFNGPVGVYDASNNLITYDDCIIFDESSNLFTDPATGEQVEVTDWTYDYTNRQYLLTTGDGNTITLTYNADQVSIVNGNVTNNYYYLVSGDGSGGSGGDGFGDGSDDGGDDGGGSGGGLLEQLVNLILKPLELLIGLVEQIIAWILDQLVGLVDMLVAKFGAVITGILSLLETIPPLFGGFYAFLGAVFGFLPPEMLAILELGLLAFVVVGLLKLIFNR